MNIKELKAKYAEYWEVFFEQIGRRENGTYLVKAANKRDAKKFVKDYDENYVVRGADAVRPYIDAMEEMGDINPDLPDFADPVIKADIEKYAKKSLNKIKYGVIACTECGT